MIMTITITIMMIIIITTVIIIIKKGSGKFITGISGNISL